MVPIYLSIYLISNQSSVIHVKSTHTYISLSKIIIQKGKLKLIKQMDQITHTFCVCDNIDFIFENHNKNNNNEKKDDGQIFFLKKTILLQEIV